MIYLKEIKVKTDGQEGLLYITDDAETAETLRSEGEAVLVYLHPGNAGQDFSRFQIGRAHV